MTQIKCSELRMKKPDELENDLHNLQQELVSLKNVHKIANVRQSIAHIHIVQNQTFKENLRSFYHGEKHKPKDLRPKQTRAMRRELTAKEQSIDLKKTQRKKCTFPTRTFAMKDWD